MDDNDAVNVGELMLCKVRFLGSGRMTYRNPSPIIEQDPPIHPYSGQRPECRKCGNVGSTFNKYDDYIDLLERECMSCKYKWTERPKDAST